jgi:hypothetical protein
MHALYRFCQKNSCACNRLIARKIRLLSGGSYRCFAIIICPFFGHCQSVGNRIRSVLETFFRLLHDYLYGRPWCDALGSAGSREVRDGRVLFTRLVTLVPQSRLEHKKNDNTRRSCLSALATGESHPLQQSNTADLYGCRYRLKKNRGAVSKARCNQLHRCTVFPLRLDDLKTIDHYSLQRALP